MEKLVSIGMPVYNRPLEMRRALESVLNQTYRNIEVVISNDNSPNPEIDRILREYAEKDARVNYHLQPKSLRTTANYRFVLDRAEGAYFMWLADDDWLEPDFIERCAAFLDANPSYSICTGLCKYTDTEGGTLSDDTSFDIDDKSAFLRSMRYHATVTLNGYMYGLMRRGLVSRIPFADELAFDWEIVGYMVYMGRFKTLPETAHHITKGGMSNESTALVNYFGKKDFLSKHFIGLSSAVNCSGYIRRSSAYGMATVPRTAYAFSVFCATYANVFRWDLLTLKRRLLKALGFKNGVLPKITRKT